MTDPLSLNEAKRLAGTADTILVRATRTADLETPIGAFLRLDDGFTPAYLLESVEGGERLGRYSFLGIGPRRLLEVTDGVARTTTRPVSVESYAPDLPVTTAATPDPLAALRAFVPRRSVLPAEGMPRFTGGAVGALSYDAISAFEPTVPRPDRDPVGVPLAAFIETDLVLVFDHLTHQLSAIASLHTEAPDLEGRYRIAERAIFEALERTGRPSAAEMAASYARSTAGDPGGRAGAPVVGTGAPAGLGHVDTSLGRDAYIDAVSHAKDAIAAGEAIQVVLARRQSFDLPAGPDGTPIDGIGLYRALRRVNPSPYLFFTRTPAFEVVGASPELLLQVVGDRMTTHPIAGTRPRGATPAEDDRLADELRRDPKERAEHVMLVDLGRNDLGRVARPGTVTTSQYMEVERYSHVLHLVSHVEARLRPELDALDALRSVFPAGTLTGAPKIRAMQLIAAAEGERRGLYGGAVGYLGYDGNLDTAITIRSAVLKGGQAHVHTGAGIVAKSVPEREFEETEHKAAALRRAIELAAAPTGSRLAPAGSPTRLARRAGAPRRAADDPRHRQLRLVHLQPRPGAAGRGRGRPRRAQRRADPGRGRGHRRGPGPGAARDRHLARARRSRARRASPSRPSGSRQTGGSRSSASASGMQSMAAAWGAAIVRAPTLVHGEASEIEHDGLGLLAGMPAGFPAARYHSLCVDRATLPGELYVTATSPEDGVVMGLRHRTLPIEGVQFHPESVLTPDGPHLLANFLRLAGEGEASRLDAASGSFATRGMAEPADGAPVAGAAPAAGVAR